jgi:hypothetical protein
MWPAKTRIDERTRRGEEYARMADSEQPTDFKILGVDDVVYGPVELPVLVSWIQEERVTADTWVYSQTADTWKKASQTPETSMFFRRRAAAAAAAASAAAPGGATADAPDKPNTGALRRVKIFADLTDDQLGQLNRYITIAPFRQWTEIVKQGEPGDAMFLLLEGEVRVRLMIAGKETTLTTMGPGEFFGEISLFDDGPRSADIVANKDSVLLKIEIPNFHKLVAEHPDIAAPLLMAIGRTLTSRIRADNKRYRDSIRFARAAGN